MTQSRESVLCPDFYPDAIESLVGRYVLLCGQIDRLLMWCLESKCGIDWQKAVGHVRDANGGSGLTLGNWIKWLKPDNNSGIIWQEKIDKNWLAACIAHLEKIKPMRDKIIHDSLVVGESGYLVWKTNTGKNDNEKRQHTDFNLRELYDALSDFTEFKEFCWISCKMHG
ncbi:MAG: hypothetical protein LW855_04830 [Alphaproteobacteria bacterium]|jgi:hypothetical protein|nr:hypothetical protein [Thalassospira sp.]MCE2965096.1 hypothetical protein [Alphaproteobacteria bacterium]